MSSWLPIACLAVVLAVIALLWWLRRSRPPSARSSAEVLTAHGSARCLAAITLLRRLAASQHQAAIVSAVETLELPLLQALPDCPPPAKAELADALEACARVTANRDIAKRLMTLRNALLG